MFGVGFRGLGGVVLGMQGVAVRCHGMMCSHFMCSGFVVLGRFAMMVRGRFVMLGSPLVVFCNFGCCGSHNGSSLHWFSYVRYLKFPRFRGHRNICVSGVRNVEETSPIPA